MDIVLLSTEEKSFAKFALRKQITTCTVTVQIKVKCLTHFGTVVVVIIIMGFWNLGKTTESLSTAIKDVASFLKVGLQV